MVIISAVLITFVIVVFIHSIARWLTDIMERMG